MGLDRERMLAKIGYIREQVVSIKDLLDRKKKEEILTDPWLIKGIKYSLQTAIEAVIDLAYHVAVKKFGHAPGDARDADRIFRFCLSLLSSVCTELKILPNIFSQYDA